jgi:hypothetical protein
MSLICKNRYEMKNVLLLIYILGLFTSIANASEYKWEAKENYVSIARKISIDGKSLAQVLKFEYSIKGQCKFAFASIILIPHLKELGKKTKEDIYDAKNKGNKLRFFIDDQEIKYSQEKIMKVEFENGVQFGTVAPKTLITELERNNGKIEVFLGDSKLISIPSYSGFNAENKKAYEHCLKNRS